MVFDSTYFQSRNSEGKYHYLLEEMLGLDAHERFSEAAETAILTEAIKTSYEEASKVIPSKSKDHKNDSDRQSPWDCRCDTFSDSGDKEKM